MDKNKRKQRGKRKVFTGSNPAADNILEVNSKRFLGAYMSEAFPGMTDSVLEYEYKKVARGKSAHYYADNVIYKDERIQGTFGL